MRIGSPSTRANFVRVDFYPLCLTHIYPATKAKENYPSKGSVNSLSG